MIVMMCDEIVLVELYDDEDQGIHVVACLRMKQYDSENE